jgi:hypothetical protein
MISGLHHKVGENFTLLSYYAASSGNSLPTFQDNLLILSSRVKISPKMSIRNYHYSSHTSPEEHGSWLFKYVSA